MSTQETLELSTTLAPDLWSAWVRESEAEQVSLAAHLRLLSTFSAHSLPEQEAPNVTHQTAGQEQHLKYTSLNCPFILLPVPLPEDPCHSEQMANLLSYQAYHQDSHHYSGSCWNVLLFFFTVSEGAILDLSYSYLKKAIQVESSRIHHSYHEEWEHHRKTRNVNCNINDKMTEKMF